MLYNRYVLNPLIWVPLPPFILAVSSLIMCVGCGDVPKPQRHEVAQVAAELPECRVGDACVFRPTYGSALVFTNLRAYQRFRRANLDVPDESYVIWRDWEAKGDYTILPKNARIRLLKDVDGGVEAMVEIDNYRPAPNGIGTVGTKIAGHKVWLESKLAPLNRWQKK
jgi:hypothetical protein